MKRKYLTTEQVEQLVRLLSLARAHDLDVVVEYNMLGFTVTLTVKGTLYDATGGVEVCEEVELMG